MSKPWHACSVRQWSAGQGQTDADETGQNTRKESHYG